MQDVAKMFLNGRKLLLVLLFSAVPCWSNVFPTDGGILFAEQFRGGVPDAVQACPSEGCMIYATSPLANRNLGSLDPGSKAITIYLGPYTYLVKQITLRRALKIIGMGASGRVPSLCTAPPCKGTSLLSVNGNSPVFVLPQSDFSPASNVLLSGFSLLGSSGNTSEDAFLLDTSSTVNSGLWYSTFSDIFVAGFAGVGLHIRGHSDSFASLTQWVHFDNVVVFRTAGGDNALRLEGSSFQLRFTDCEFDGQTAGDGTNIFIGGSAGSIDGYPLSIVFEGLVSQAAAVAVDLDGAVNVSFHSSHHEKLWGVYQITNDFNIWTKGLTISDSFFAGDAGKNAGAGYLLDVSTTLAAGISFANNRITGDPDSVVKATNLASVTYRDSYYEGAASVPPTSGITSNITPASTINIHGAHSVGLSPSRTPITTIESSLGPGETVTFFVLAGAVSFAPGGNINFMGAKGAMVNGSITFVRSDLTGRLEWTPVSQWSPTGM
jgi:hypothetical protein